MKIDLFDTKEFIELNNLKEVTSGVLFQRGNVPHPNGLISNDIFGITVKSRKETFAYIDLHGYFFHPHVYKAIKRMFRNIEKIIGGEEYWALSEDGTLVKDPNGETGIDFIYNNWEKIKWEYSDKSSMRNERINLITKTPKNKIFTKYLIVIPAFYRDITTTQKGGGETGELNTLYAKEIRMCSLLKDKNMFDFQLHSTNLNIQSTLVEIYDYFKNKIEKKNGLIRKYLMGKNTDYATRTVITAPIYHANRPNDVMIDFEHSGIPISQVCSLCYPFIIRWIKNFFEREVIDQKYNKIIYDPTSDIEKTGVEIIDPESYFNEKYIKKMIDTFIKDPESRFNKIEIPTNRKQECYLQFRGYRTDYSNKSEVSNIVYRPMTWTDLLYMAAEDVTKDKHSVVTRYPVSDEYGLFITKIRVLSTIETIPMQVGERVYRWYPKIDFNIPENKIGSCFIDSTQFSNSYLEGIGGDYDGDQTTIKILFSQEANKDCSDCMKNKSFFVNGLGNMVRVLGSEPIQTFYCLTKDYNITNPKSLSLLEKKYFLDMKPEDITFDLLVDWFGSISDNSKTKNYKKNEPKFHPSDKLILNTNEYFNKEKIETTLGRLVFNKIIVEGCHLENILGYINNELTTKNYKAIDRKIADALVDDLITIDTMYNYVNTRDWLGFELHPIVTASFTPGVLKLPKEVDNLRQELYKKYKSELESGNERVIENIEKILLGKVKETLKDDPGMELYTSGARGSLENNFKNIFVSRGAVKNTVTGKYDILTKSFMDGLDKKDIPAHSNSILAGAYPKSVGTAETGYLAKQLLSAFQSEVLGDYGSDCGTKKTINILLTNYNKKDFTYRYIVENSKLVCLTPDIIDKYVNKTVQMRTPMYCTNDCLCNKCAGDSYYKLGKKDIGITTSRVATTLTNLNMKKFHQNLIISKQIDPDKMFE